MNEIMDLILFLLIVGALLSVAIQPVSRTTAYEREFRRVRRTVLARDGYHCQYPGCHRHGPGMHVHHRVYRSHGGTNRPSNLVTLCPYHHQLIHGRWFR